MGVRGDLYSLSFDGAHADPEENPTAAFVLAERGEALMAYPPVPRVPVIT